MSMWPWTRGGEDVFVVGAVEDADHSAGRDLGLAAPEEVVAEFEGGGDFEGRDVAALGIDAGEDVADDAVFAGGVHALEDDENGFCLGGVEEFLEVGELRAVLGGDAFGGDLVVESVVVVGGELGELDLGVGSDEIGRLDLHGCEMLRGAFSVEKQG